jgi:hypothetical protein
MVDRFQIALYHQHFQLRFISISSQRLQNHMSFMFSHPLLTAVPHSDFWDNCETFSCLPPTAVPHSDFWDNHEMLGWVGQAAGMFSHFLFFFFLANFLFCSPVTALSPPH